MASTLTETVETKKGMVDRPVRVDFPVLVSFSSDTYTAREFTLNLSEGGMFIPTEKISADSSVSFPVDI